MFSRPWGTGLAWSPGSNTKGCLGTGVGRGAGDGLSDVFLCLSLCVTGLGRGLGVLVGPQGQGRGIWGAVGRRAMGRGGWGQGLQDPVLGAPDSTCIHRDRHLQLAGGNSVANRCPNYR